MAKKKKKSNEIMAEARAAKAADTSKKRAKKKAKPVEKVPLEEEGGKGKLDEGMEAIGKLVDHPLVADIVAAGAVAAVASLAENQVTRARGTSGGSKETLKFAGKAAAAAMGKRFMAEMEAAKARREAEDLDGEEE